MKWKTWAPAVLAVVLGGMAAKLARDSMMKPRPTIVTAPKAVQIVVANTNLIAGQEIRGENVTVSTITSPQPPVDVFTNPGDVVGRVITTQILKGQAILVSSLALRGSGAGLPSLVPPGMRAFTMNVDETNSLAGMLLPGCHVDVIGTLNAGKSSLTRTLVKNVLVQAVGQRLTSAKPEDGKEPAAYHTITLIVTPHEAHIMDLASSSARIRLLLRGLVHSDLDDNDNSMATISDIKGTDDDDDSADHPKLLFDQHPTTQPAGNGSTMAQNPKWSVELIKGSTVTHQQFDMPVASVQADTSNDQRQPAIPGQSGGEDSQE